MSRAALWKQEANVQERERQATDAFLEAIEAGKNNRVKGLVPLHGSEDSFNLNPVLLQAITRSIYFQNKCLKEIQDWNRLVDEIYYEVKHLQPFSHGATKTPSTAFCLLLRLFTLRCSEKQMKLMLDHVDSPFIRCIGFLYLRYACEPRLLWDWVEPYLYDEEPVKVEANRPETTVGQFVCSLLKDMNYHGTLLPRLPVTIEREIKVKLLQAQQIEDRALHHCKNSRAMQYFQTIGSRVRALYGDEENPVTWYDGVVDRVITVDEETREPLSRPKFVVTFPDYGNTEIVTLGELDMPGGSGGGGESHRDRSAERGYNDDKRRGFDRRDDRRSGYDQRGGSRGYHDRDGRRDDRWDGDRGRKRSRSRERDSKPPSERDLMEEVRRQEREKSLSQGKSYASRPPSTKASLTSGGGGSILPPDDDTGSSRQHKRPPPPEAEKPPDKEPKKKSPEEIAAIQEKKQKLMAKYG